MNDYVFGNFIFELRTEKGLSQSELGKILGVSNKAVSKWETGEAKPRADKLTLLAKTLGVTVEELLCGERKKNGKDRGEEISYAIGMFAREYRRAKTEFLVFTVCFFSSPVLMLLVLGIALLSGDAYAVWAIALMVTCAVTHIVAEVGVIVSFILMVKRKRLLYASFPSRREEISACTHTVPPAKKTGKLGLIVLIGVVLMGIAVATILSVLKIADGSVVELAVIGCALAFGIGNVLFTRLWLRRIDRRMHAQAFEIALRDAKFLLEVWLPDGRSALCDVLRLNIAVAYFSLRDDENFRDYLNEITTRRFSFVKSFLKCVDAFAQGDRESFRAEYDVFLSTIETSEKKTAKAVSFYAERARLLFELAEGNAKVKEKLLLLFENPRIRECIEEWKVR